MTNCASCPNDKGHTDGIWKFVPYDDQPSDENYVGVFSKVSDEENCFECRLKYGLSDVTSIWLPKYVQNTFYTENTGKIVVV